MKNIFLTSTIVVCIAGLVFFGCSSINRITTSETKSNVEIDKTAENETPTEKTAKTDEEQSKKMGSRAPAAFTGVTLPPAAANINYVGSFQMVNRDGNLCLNYDL